jgi:hypothetical protein
MKRGWGIFMSTNHGPVERLPALFLLFGTILKKQEYEVPKLSGRELASSVTMHAFFRATLLHTFKIPLSLLGAATNRTILNISIPGVGSFFSLISYAVFRPYP